MRKDMSKLLCERPRRCYNRNVERKFRRQFNNPELFEVAAPRSGNSRGRLYGWAAKELSENLSPLERFLENRVGRPWNDVYSELRSELRLNSAVQLHVMQHLWDFVDREVKKSDQGNLVRPAVSVRADRGLAKQLTVNGKGGWTRLRRNGSWKSLFVHPVTGLLCDARRPGLGERGRRGPSVPNDTRP